MKTNEEDGGEAKANDEDEDEDEDEEEEDEEEDEDEDEDDDDEEDEEGDEEEGEDGMQIRGQGIGEAGTGFVDAAVHSSVQADDGISFDDDDVNGYLRRLGFRDMTYDEGGELSGVHLGDSDENEGADIASAFSSAAHPSNSAAAANGADQRTTSKSWEGEHMFREELFPSVRLEGSGSSASSSSGLPMFPLERFISDGGGNGGGPSDDGGDQAPQLEALLSVVASAKQVRSSEERKTNIYACR